MWQSSAKAYLVPIIMVGQGGMVGGGEGKSDGNICESTNND